MREDRHSEETKVQKRNTAKIVFIALIFMTANRSYEC